MFRAAALVPSPPLLVPELMGRSADERTDLRSAVLESVDVLGARWIALGIGPAAQVIGPDSVGTFQGFGVDVPVALSPESPSGHVDADLPLAALIAGWIRGAAAPSSRVEVRTLTAETMPSAAHEFGVALRAELDHDAEDWGVLVVADGASTLTPKAPGSFDERSTDVQADLDRALGTADRDALQRLDPQLCAELGVGGRAVWQALAGLTRGDDVRSTALYTGAPYGVGYFVGTWTV